VRAKPTDGTTKTKQDDDSGDGGEDDDTSSTGSVTNTHDPHTPTNYEDRDFRGVTGVISTESFRDYLTTYYPGDAEDRIQLMGRFNRLAHQVGSPFLLDARELPHILPMVEAEIVSREYKRIGNDNTRNPWHIYYKASGVCEGLICEGGTGLGPGLLVESFVGGSFLLLGLLTFGLIFKSTWDEAQLIRRGQQLVDEGEARLAAGVLAQARESGSSVTVAITPPGSPKRNSGFRDRTPGRTIVRRQPSGGGGAAAAVCLARATSTSPVPTIRRTNSGAVLDLSQLSPTVLHDFTLQQHSAGGAEAAARGWPGPSGPTQSPPSEAPSFASTFRAPSFIWGAPKEKMSRSGSRGSLPGLSDAGEEALPPSASRAGSLSTVDGIPPYAPPNGWPTWPAASPPSSVAGGSSLPRSEDSGRKSVLRAVSEGDELWHSRRGRQPPMPQAVRAGGDDGEGGGGKMSRFVGDFLAAVGWREEKTKPVVTPDAALRAAQWRARVADGAPQASTDLEHGGGRGAEASPASPSRSAASTASSFPTPPPPPPLERKASWLEQRFSETVDRFLDPL